MLRTWVTDAIYASWPLNIPVVSMAGPLKTSNKCMLLITLTVAITWNYFYLWCVCDLFLYYSTSRCTTLLWNYNFSFLFSVCTYVTFITCSHTFIIHCILLHCNAGTVITFYVSFLFPHTRVPDPFQSDGNG